MRHRSSIALLAFGLLLPLAACSDSDDGGAIVADDDGAGTTAPQEESPSEGSGGSVDAITIEGFAFTDVTVAPGATVEVTNADSTGHTVTSDDDDWDEVSLGADESGSLTAPDAPGAYTFHCEIHPTMTGTLTVQ